MESALVAIHYKKHWCSSEGPWCVCVVCVCVHVCVLLWCVSECVRAWARYRYTSDVCDSRTRRRSDIEGPIITRIRNKISVGQAPRLCNGPSKINVTYTSVDDLAKESRQYVPRITSRSDGHNKNELFPFLMPSLLAFPNFVMLPGCERASG